MSAPVTTVQVVDKNAMATVQLVDGSPMLTATVVAQAAAMTVQIVDRGAMMTASLFNPDGSPWIAGPVPVMDSNFLTGIVPPGITFSRASGATLVDATGKVAWAPHNLIPFSESYSAATGGWNGDGMTAEPAGAGVSGFTNASFGFSSSSVGTNFPRTQNTDAAAGQTVTCGAWIWLVAGAGTVTVTPAYFSNGSWKYPVADIALTATPQFFTWTYTPTDATTLGSAFSLRIAHSAAVNIRLSGVQVCRGAALQPYYPTSGAAYEGPRLTYDPVTMAPLGLLIEPTRTNLVLSSSNLASLQTDQSGNTPDVALAPDGTVTADALTDNATASRHISYFSLSGLTVSSTYTFSSFLKESTLRYAVVQLSAPGGLIYGALVDLRTGVVLEERQAGSPSNRSTLVTKYGNGWFRVAVTMTLGTTTGTTYAVVATSNSATPTYDANNDPTYVGTGQSIYVWGQQLEVGTEATSYIPTYGATATRANDALQVPRSETSGTYCLEYFSLRAPGKPLGVLMSGSDELATMQALGYTATWNNSVEGGGAYTNVSTSVVRKVANAWTAASQSVAENGLGPITIASGLHPVTSYQASGSFSGGGVGANGSPYLLRRLRFYTSQLTSPQLQSLTAP